MKDLPHWKVLKGNLCGVVRYLTDRELGSVLLPDTIDEVTGDSVTEVLKSKHPDARTPDTSQFPTYPNTPNFVDLDVTEEVVEAVASKLSGSAGLGGVDSQALQHWLLRFGSASKSLRLEVAGFASWMANGFPPWAAYRALMGG